MPYLFGWVIVTFEESSSVDFAAGRLFLTTIC
jgi:hypothetical protein